MTIENYETYLNMRKELIQKYPKIIQIEKTHRLKYRIYITFAVVFPILLSSLSNMLTQATNENIFFPLEYVIVFSLFLLALCAVAYSLSFDEMLPTINEIIKKKNINHNNQKILKKYE